jgi:hypothetical protein
MFGAQPTQLTGLMGQTPVLQQGDVVVIADEHVGCRAPLA